MQARSPRCLWSAKTPLGGFQRNVTLLHSGIASVTNACVLLGVLFSFPLVLHWTGAPQVADISPQNAQHTRAFMKFCFVLASIAADYWDGRLPREAHFVELLRSRYPRAERPEDIRLFVRERRPRRGRWWW